MQSGYMAKVLIADDDPISREITAEALASGGHDVLLATNGREALDRLGSESFDLAVIDIHMPEVDGFEAILEIKQTVPWLRIIAVTAGASYDDGNYLQTARIFGAHASLRKPIPTADLLDLVQHLCADRQTVRV